VIIFRGIISAMSGLNFRAIIFSIVAHLICLGIFYSLNFSMKPTQSISTEPAILSSVITDYQSPILPKPNITKNKSIAFNNFIIPENLEKVESPVIQQKNINDIAKNKDFIPENITLDLFDKENIKFFQSSTKTRHICYVIDSSGSMHGNFAFVRENIINSINSMEADCYFFIIFFGNGRIIQFENNWTRANLSAKNKAKNFIESIKPAGQTNSVSAIKTAIDICAQNNKASTIFFLSDGFGFADNSVDVFGNIKNHIINSKPVVIHTFGFARQNQDEMILEKIAKLTGGYYNLIK
jgi:hypothetical protein